MPIPILDLTRQYRSIRSEIDAAIQRVVESGWFILGPEVEALEKEIAAYCGVKHAIGVASGTDALLLSLRAVGIGPGDGVIVPSFTFFATAGVVHNVGATPIFCDIDARTFNLDLESVRAILADWGGRTTRRGATVQRSQFESCVPKAIIPVHLYGQMADMGKVIEIAREFNLYVVEDAAQAIGATYFESLGCKVRQEGGMSTYPSAHGTFNRPPAMKAGTIGHLGCFSFFPTKNLGAYGDGGMVVTNDDDLAERIRMLRVHGSRPKYYHHFVGYNSRLDALQAAILRAKLPHLAAWTAERNRIAARYDELLSDLPGIELPYRAPNCTHIFHQYTIRVLNGRRDALRDFLKKRDIGTEIYYPLPLHLQKCFAHLEYQAGDLPESERASREVLSLPMFPELTESEVEEVAQAVTDFIESGGG